jgi:hypothetical protein
MVLVLMPWSCCSPGPDATAAAAAVTVTPPLTGITYSDDKLLQTRIFSYADTQRHRWGVVVVLVLVMLVVAFVQGLRTRGDLYRGCIGPLVWRTC